MDQKHYYKKYLWDTVSHICVIIIGFTPFAFLVLDISLARGISLIILSIALLAASIYARARLLAKEGEHTT